MAEIKKVQITLSFYNRQQQKVAQLVIRLDRYYIDLGSNPLSSTFIFFSYYAAKNQKKPLAIYYGF